MKQTTDRYAPFSQDYLENAIKVIDTYLHQLARQWLVEAIR